MVNYMSDFQTFLDYIMSGIIQIFTWISTTILGEIMFFTLMILIFLFAIRLIIGLKD